MCEMLGTTTNKLHTTANWLSQFTEPSYKHGVTSFINSSCPDVAVCLCILHVILYELYHMFLMRTCEAPEGYKQSQFRTTAITMAHSLQGAVWLPAYCSYSYIQYS
jgi:hypothetical protein